MTSKMAAELLLMTGGSKHVVTYDLSGGKFTYAGGRGFGFGDYSYVLPVGEREVVVSYKDERVELFDVFTRKVLKKRTFPDGDTNFGNKMKLNWCREGESFFALKKNNFNLFEINPELKVARSFKHDDVTNTTMALDNVYSFGALGGKKTMKLWDLEREDAIKVIDWEKKTFFGRVKFLDFYDNGLLMTGYSGAQFYDPRADYRKVMKLNQNGFLEGIVRIEENFQVVMVNTSDICVYDIRNEKKPLWARKKFSKGVSAMCKYRPNCVITSSGSFVEKWDLEKKTYETIAKNYGRVVSMCVMKTKSELLPKGRVSLQSGEKDFDKYEKAIDEHKEHFVVPPYRPGDCFENVLYDKLLCDKFKKMLDKIAPVVEENRKRMINMDKVTVWVAEGYKVYKRYEGQQKNLKPHGKGTLYNDFSNRRGLFVGYDGLWADGQRKFGRSFDNFGHLKVYGKFNEDFHRRKEEEKNKNIIEKLLTVKIIQDSSQNYFDPRSYRPGEGTYFKTGKVNQQDECLVVMKKMKSLIDKEPTRVYDVAQYGIAIKGEELNDIVLKEGENYYDVIEGMVMERMKTDLKKWKNDAKLDRGEVKKLEKEIKKIENENTRLQKEVTRNTNAYREKLEHSKKETTKTKKDLKDLQGKYGHLTKEVNELRENLDRSKKNNTRTTNAYLEKLEHSKKETTKTKKDLKDLQGKYGHLTKEVNELRENLDCSKKNNAKLREEMKTTTTDLHEKLRNGIIEKERSRRILTAEKNKLAEEKMKLEEDIKKREAFQQEQKKDIDVLKEKVGQSVKSKKILEKTRRDEVGKWKGRCVVSFVVLFVFICVILNFIVFK